MTTLHYTKTLLLDQTPEEVFNAINNAKEWWGGDVKGNSEKLNDVFTYQAGEVHFSAQKIVEFVPYSKVVWLVTESKINFVENKNEWTGTKISFEISKINDKTKMTFKHLGLVPQIECFNDCSNAWSQLIQQSLLNLITTGKGKKIF